MKSKDLSDSKEIYELIKFRDFLTGVGMRIIKRFLIFDALNENLKRVLKFWISISNFKIVGKQLIRFFVNNAIKSNNL